MHAFNMCFHKGLGQTCCCRHTLSNIKTVIAAGKETVAEAASKDLLSKPQCFELFTVNPRNKCKAYRYAYGTSTQVCLLCKYGRGGRGAGWQDRGRFLRNIMHER